MTVQKHDTDDHDNPDPGAQAEEERRRGRVEDQPGDPTSGEAERMGKPEGGRGFEQRDEPGQYTSAGGPGMQKK